MPSTSRRTPPRRPQSSSRPTSGRSAPKNTKADGAAKQRWTAAERRERGRPPRRSGGAPRSAASRPAEVTPPSRFERTRPEADRTADRFERARPRADRSTSSRFERTRPKPDRPVRPFDRTRPKADRPVGRLERDRSEVAPRHQPRPEASATFAELGLPAALVAVLAERSIERPFAIQTTTIPDALAGRDVLGRAQTGSGKTLAFGLPLLTRLAGRSARRPRAMVLTPTRELATQVSDALAPLAAAVGLRTTLVAGGLSYTPQIRAFERGVDVVIATPGRLIDLVEQGVADLGEVEVAVLDEADHMADLGFLPAVTTLMDAVPANGQRLLFSATLDRAVDSLVRDYLSAPVTHEVDASTASVATMEHHLLQVHPHDKANLTAELAARPGRTVVFVRTQLGAERVAEQLRAAGVLAGALHGGLTQGARNRVLAVFKEGTLPVLVATDVAARGIHVDDVSLVLQVDPPPSGKDYLHRAGRTARAGAHGVVATLALPHQRREVTRMAREAGLSAVLAPVRSGDPALAELTGGRSIAGEPVTAEAYEALIAPPRKTGPRRGRAWSGVDRGPRRAREHAPGDRGPRHRRS